jgi:hypothetical protein
MTVVLWKDWVTFRSSQTGINKVGVIVSSSENVSLGSGVVLVGNREKLSFNLEEGGETLILEVLFIEPDTATPLQPPNMQLKILTDQTAQAIFRRTTGPLGMTYPLVPLGTLHDKVLSANFRVSNLGTVVEFTYSFWLGPQ